MAGALKGITIEIGGNTTELSDELGRLGKSAKETGSDLAAVERALKFNPDNVELLAQRQKYASEQAQTLRQRLDAVNQALSSGGVEEGTRAYDQLRREVITTTDRIEKMEAKARESAEAMERIRSGANDAAQGLDALGDAADRAGSKIDATKEFLTGIMFSLGEDALDAGKSVVASAVESAVAYDDAGARIEAAVGGATDSARALSEVGRDLYSEGWGDSIDQMTDSVIQVREVMGDLSETDLSTVTRAAYTMEEAFGSDLSETLRGMDTLMVQFGLSANEAADMMVAGAQRGLDYTDELGDNVAEYGGRWAEAGLSASEYFSMLQAGVDAGAYSLDRVGDYLNEFLTSLSDGRMEEAIGGFSEGTQAVWESYQDGGATARDVLDAVIGEMRDCQSETEAMSKASELWGSLGEDNALDVVLALGDVTDSYGDVAGAAEEAGDAIEGGLGNKIESLGRKAQGVFETVAEPIVGMAEDALDAVDPLIEGFSNLDDGTQRLVVTLGALVAAGPKLAGAARTAKGAFDGLGQSIGGVTESRLTTPWMALIGILGGEVASAVGTYAEDCATAAENSERLADISGGVARQLAEIGEADVSPDGMDSLSESIDETAESIDGLISRSRQTSDEVISLFEEIASWESELGSNSSRLDAAVETIGELTTGQALSEDQQRDLALAVADYNEITGESVGVIDATTGALDTSTESIRQNAQAWKDNARLQGLIDYYGNLSAELAVTKSQTDSLREAYEQAQAAYDAARDEVTVIGGDGGEWQLYWDGWDGKGGEALMEAEDRLNAAKQAYDENQTAVEQLGQEIAATEAEIDSFNSAQVEAATSTGQAGDAASDAADSTGTLGESLKGLRGSSEGLWDVHDALDDLSEWAPDATEAIEGAMSSLDDGSVTLSQATDQINSALRDAGVEFDGFNEAQVEVMLRAGMTAEEIEREAESLAGAAQAAGEAGGELEGALAGMRGSADGLWDAGEAVRDLAGWAPDAAQAIERSFDALDRSGGDISAVTSEINAALQEAIPGFDGFNDAQVVTMFQAGMTGEEIEGLARSLAEAGDAAEESGGQIEAALQGYYGAEEGARDLASALDEAADYSQDAGAAIDVAFQDFNSTGGDIHDLASQINQILKEQGVITDDLSEAWVREAYAQGAAGDEVVRLAERQQELSDAEREQAEAAEEAARAREQAVESLREFADATPGMQQAIEASGSSLEEFALRLEETGYSIDQFKQDSV